MTCMLPDDVLFSYAMSFIGLPYKWAGQHPSEGYDCSGLCCEIAQASHLIKHGVDLTAKGLYEALLIGGGTIVNTASLGCYAFFGSSASSISHVGFCIDSLSMIEAGGGNSKTVTTEEAIKKRAFVRIRPIKYRKDFLFTLRP